MAEQEENGFGVPASDRDPVEVAAIRCATANDADILLLNAPIRVGLDHMVLRTLRSRSRARNLIVIVVTEGGDANQAFRVARFFQDLYVTVTAVVAGWCKSAGTLICIGAGKLLMGDLGELGPLDVQIARTDDLIGRSSGLTDDAAFRTLQTASFNLFETFLFDITAHSGGRVTLKTAAEISASITVGLLEPIFAQFDPRAIGDNYRSTAVAREYAARLNIEARNMQSADAIDALVRGYPSHAFVIDRKEATTLFRDVKAIEGHLFELVELLQFDAMMPADTPIVRFLNLERTATHGTTKHSGSPPPSAGGTDGAETDAADGGAGGISPTPAASSGEFPVPSEEGRTSESGQNA